MRPQRPAGELSHSLFHTAGWTSRQHLGKSLFHHVIYSIPLEVQGSGEQRTRAPLAGRLP